MKIKNFSITKEVFNEETYITTNQVIDYEITKFDGDRGFQLATKSIKVFVPLLMPVFQGLRDLAGKTEEEIKAQAVKLLDDNFFKSISETITQNFNDKEVYSLIKELLTCVVYVENGNKYELSKNFAEHFRGWYDPIIPLTVEVLKHNGFFGLIAKAIGLTKAIK